VGEASKGWSADAAWIALMYAYVGARALSTP
jgi:hypothetical protein